MTSLPPVDVLIKMSDEDLEKLREELFEQAIANKSEEEKVRERAKQWNYLHRLNKIKNPLSKAQAAQNQMLDSFAQLNAAFDPFRSK